MKFSKLTVGIVATVVMLAGTVSGQIADFYRVPREVILAAPATLSTVGTATVTNGAIDTAMFSGIARIQIFALTNAAGVAQTALLEQSDDSTNWSTFPNYALATTTSLSFTNSQLGGGTNTIITQSFLFPGSIVTPTANTSGWATPYINYGQFTNTGALTISKGYYNIAYNVDSVKRYTHIIWTCAAASTATNITVGAVFIGSRGGGP